MLNQLSLRFRIYSVLTTLVLITLVGDLVMVWYTYRMERLLSEFIDRNLASFQAAEALQSALLSQKGFVSYYFQDGDPTWLRHLGEYRQRFKERFKDARSLIDSEPERATMDKIESEYALHLSLKDRVIDHYKVGEKEKGVRLNRQVREHFFKVLQLCDDYKAFQTSQMNEVKRQSLSQARKLRIVAGFAILCLFLLAVILSFVLVHQILGSLSDEHYDKQTTR